jgi:hypothetical protein
VQLMANHTWRTEKRAEKVRQQKILTAQNGMLGPEDEYLKRRQFRSNSQVGDAFKKGDG